MSAGPAAGGTDSCHSHSLDFVNGMFVSPPPNSHVETINLNVVVGGDATFGR